ncbi:MAG: radical SAM protein [Spirochaetales bacterium]|nr:radical SAM protein [Spirochaetales bacterium]
MNYVFGPVPSRRLGRSLGVDPTARPGGHKACNWNCVYCQLGHTRHLMTGRERFFPPEAVLDELQSALKESQGGVDWITFVGSGEPTLNIDLGAMLRGVKAMTSLPVAVITNGSTLCFPEVREELSVADAVMPTLDAGDERTFLRINRPQHLYSYKRHVDGLTAFRREYKGKLWLETMMIAGQNDDEESLERLAAVLGAIAPDEVHLVLPTRPPVETWVTPTDADGLLRAQAILGRVTKVVHPDAAYGDFSLGADTDPFEAAAKTLARHPMSDEELRRALNLWGAADADTVLQALAKSGRAHEIRRYGKVFWLGSLPETDAKGRETEQ